MKKFILINLIVLFCICSIFTSYAATETVQQYITQERIDKQLERINPELLNYISKINIKDKADYVIPGRIVLADANTDYIITIYQNDITDEDLYNVLLHEIGHLVYWKTGQTYADLEKWADYFMKIHRWEWNATIQEKIKYENEVLS